LYFTPATKLSHFLLSSIIISITFHSEPEGIYREESFTFFDFSPNTAWINFSSADNSHSDFGVILPTIISHHFITDHILAIPFSSKLANLDKLIHGISFVSSSSHNLVSETSISYSSI
jgi:hypothetical protein